MRKENDRGVQEEGGEDTESRETFFWTPTTSLGTRAVSSVIFTATKVRAVSMAASRRGVVAAQIV